MDEKMPLKSVTLIGTGNVGRHLGKKLRDSGYSIVQVVGRNKERTSETAHELACPYTTDLSKIRTDVSLIILSVNDRSVAGIADRLNAGDALVVHTAGAVAMDVFRNKVKNYGVLYPVQTFSRARQPEFNGLPFCIEANTPENETLLENLVLSVSAYPVRMNSEKRAFLHLAAVFVNNFQNFLYVSAGEILDQAGLPFSLLSPIIHETVEKALEIGPKKAQTGPAVRNDENVIKKHTELLSFSPEIREIYTMMTRNIKRYRWQ